MPVFHYNLSDDILMFNKINFNNIIIFLEVTLSRYGMVQYNLTTSEESIDATNATYSKQCKMIGSTQY